MPNLAITSWTNLPESNYGEALFWPCAFSTRTDDTGRIVWHKIGPTGHAASRDEGVSLANCRNAAEAMGCHVIEELYDGDPVTPAEYRLLFNADLPGSVPQAPKTAGYPARELPQS